MIKVPLSTVTGNEFAVYIDQESTIRQLKQILEKEYNLHSHYLKLIYKATILPDNKKIKDIDINNNSCIFVHQSNLRATRPTKPGPLPSKNPELKSSNQAIPPPCNPYIESTQKTQSLKQSNKGNDSPSFQSLVENLKDLGFEQRLCENALKLSNNDVDAAAALLFSGDISYLQSPQQQKQHFQNTQNQRHHSLTVEDELDQLLLKYKKLTSEQQAAVDRLQKLGFHIETVMQVYFACGKNEQIAKDCLMTMK